MLNKLKFKKALENKKSGVTIGPILLVFTVMVILLSVVLVLQFVNSKSQTSNNADYGYEEDVNGEDASN